MFVGVGVEARKDPMDEYSCVYHFRLLGSTQGLFYILLRLRRPSDSLSLGKDSSPWERRCSRQLHTMGGRPATQRREGV